MPFITIGTTSQLQIQLPTRATTGWDETLRTNTFVKIAEHDHTGVSGKGAQISTAALAADSVTGAKIRLDNDQYLRGRNAANSADINIIKVNSSNTLTLGTTLAAPTFTTPILGVPTSGTLTNCTGLPVSTGISGLAANIAQFLATPSSANLLAAVTDETGTGALVFANAPTLVTPVLGVATATSINKVALTAPATSATLALADGSTLATSGANSITLTSTGATNVTLPTSGTLSTLAGSESLTNKTIDADLNTITNIENADIKAAAAIAVNKLAALTASRAVASDGSGFLTVSATTATELGYVSGVTSAIQTQINTKAALAGDTFTGNIVVDNAKEIRFSETDANGSHYFGIKAPDSVTASTTMSLPDGVGSSGQVLSTNGSNAMSWINAPDPANTYRTNHILNGNFTLTQSNTGWTGVNATQHVNDMWRYIHATSGAILTIDPANASIPTVGATAVQSNHSLSLEVTTADGTIGAGDYSGVCHLMEGYDFLRIHQQQVTLSFWVYATVTGTYCVAFQNSAANRSYVAEYTVSVSNTWEKKTVTLTLDTVGTFLFTTGVGLRTFFSQACGSTYQTAAGAWAAGDYRGTSNQVNNLATIGNLFRLAQVQLELGDTATRFKYASGSFPAEVLALFRYYEVFEIADYLPVGRTQSTTVCDVPVSWTVKKRATPTASLLNASYTALTGNGATVYQSGGAAVTSGAGGSNTIIGTLSTNIARIRHTTDGTLVADRVGGLILPAAGFLHIDARLT